MVSGRRLCDIIDIQHVISSSLADRSCHTRDSMITLPIRLFCGDFLGRLRANHNSPSWQGPLNMADEDTTDTTTAFHDADDGTSTSPVDIRTACHKALAIPHILKSIICGMPPAEISNHAERVCSLWRATIRSSEWIRLTRVLAPMATDSRPDSQDRCELCYECCVPRYDTSNMSFNPALPSIDQRTTCCGIKSFQFFGRWEEEYNMYAQGSGGEWCHASLQRAGDSLSGEFITSPRCEAVSLTVTPVLGVEVIRLEPEPHTDALCGIRVVRSHHQRLDQRGSEDGVGASSNGGMAVQSRGGTDGQRVP